MPNLSHVDNAGRIWIDGSHVGWVRKEADLDAVRERFLLLGVSHMPLLCDMTFLQKAGRMADAIRAAEQ